MKCREAILALATAAAVILALIGFEPKYSLRIVRVFERLHGRTGLTVSAGRSRS